MLGPKPLMTNISQTKSQATSQLPVVNNTSSRSLLSSPFSSWGTPVLMPPATSLLCSDCVWVEGVFLFVLFWHLGVLCFASLFEGQLEVAGFFYQFILIHTISYYFVLFHITKTTRSRRESGERDKAMRLLLLQRWEETFQVLGHRKG